MKKIRPYGLLAVGLLGGSFAARSQASPAPTVLGAAGQEFSAAGILLDWTVGEVAVAAWQPAGAAQLLEGFHRGPWQPVAAPEAVSVYPNPFRSEAWVRLPATAAAAQLTLYDLQGRQVRTFSATAEGGTLHLDLADLPVAGYVLSVYDPASGHRTFHVLVKND
ncbi:T9SS type A sorting domain-containing protein [Hymenobacter cheonanensis]|uniref:T9SS type A sorting domain-containing protein n=1 Tax=Hymenobacter sp. CA2-7 TaxID=3063993 RepID=UPI00271346EE|nr:T9SS type A sorting domain-containing protein [Hymenobacter sp. CA2-7]MDO7884023.1 T9SS type A sorting domain-containing protein [Hymenobacter sp. CA2-7]